MFEQTVEIGPYRFVVVNTAHNMVTYFMWADVWALDEGDPENTWKNNFMWAAAHTVEVSGVDGWKLPPRQATAKQLEAAYTKLMTSVPFEVARAWHAAADAIHASPASSVEKRDRDLTEDEAADPN